MCFEHYFCSLATQGEPRCEWLSRTDSAWHERDTRSMNKCLDLALCSFIPRLVLNSWTSFLARLIHSPGCLRLAIGSSLNRKTSSKIGCEVSRVSPAHRDQLPGTIIKKSSSFCVAPLNAFSWFRSRPINWSSKGNEITRLGELFG